MKKSTWYSYVKRKNLINRIYDMLNYFKLFENEEYNGCDAILYINKNINNQLFIETLQKYLCSKYNKNKTKIELRCNLKDLITDLDYLKQFLDN